MAVYTEVGDAELEQFLRAYDLGNLLSFKGIAEGSRTPTSCCAPRPGNFILTLYEKRVSQADLPFFLG
jgi:homoserine kinase type II